MKKNNIFTFNFMNYMKRFGIIELVLMIISIFLFAPLFVLFLFLSIIHFCLCFNQTITLDPFQVERKYKNEGGIGPDRISEKIEKYYYINEMTKYEKNYMFIIIFGDIEYKKKYNLNGTYEEIVNKRNSVKIYRSLKNEKEFIEALNKKLENREI